MGYKEAKTNGCFFIFLYSSFVLFQTSTHSVLSSLTHQSIALIASSFPPLNPSKLNSVKSKVTHLGTFNICRELIIFCYCHSVFLHLPSFPGRCLLVFCTRTQSLEPQPSSQVTVILQACRHLFGYIHLVPVNHPDNLFFSSSLYPESLLYYTLSR